MHGHKCVTSACIQTSYVMLNDKHHFLQQSCGSGVLADGRLADLIRRVATFGMVLMKLDLRQVCFYFIVEEVSFS